MGPPLPREKGREEEDRVGKTGQAAEGKGKAGGWGGRGGDWRRTAER